MKVGVALVNFLAYFDIISCGNYIDAVISSIAPLNYRFIDMHHIAIGYKFIAI